MLPLLFMLFDSSMAAEPIVVGPQVEASVTFTRFVLEDDGLLLGESSGVIRQVVLDELRDVGYDVRGGESVVFDVDRSREADFQLGGVILYGRCTYACEISLEWQLLETRSQQVVYTLPVTVKGARYTSSYTSAEQRVASAIREATRVLLAREPFVGVLTAEVAVDTAPTWTGTLPLRPCPETERTLPEDMEPVLDAVVGIRAGDSSGTGVVVSPDGWTLTAAHVVGDADEVEVELRSGVQTTGRVTRIDDVNDVALVQINGTGFACLPPTEPKIGAPLWAVGNPLGKGLELSVSRGIVSGLRQHEGLHFLQTDASINAGNSGGPLVDGSGGLLGVVSFKVAGLGIEGLGFGVPMGAVVERLDLTWSDTAAVDPRSFEGQISTPVREVVVDEVPREPPKPLELPEPPKTPAPPMPTSVWVGLATSMVGVGGVAGTWIQGTNADRMRSDQWTMLQAGNAASWGVVGTGSVITLIGLAKHAKEAQALRAEGSP